MLLRPILIAILLFLTACDGQKVVNNTKVDFKQVDWYAKRAAESYRSEQDIKSAFPDTVWVATTPSTQVQYFLERNNQNQILTIRGTDNLKNIREDAEYIQSRNPKLNIYVHSGFDEDAYQIFQEIAPKLKKDTPVIVTGHSLGAAIATLLMMYLHEEGYELGLSINFGQPKVTNRKGAQKYRFLPLLRVVDENDLVPLVPPRDFLDSIHGAYEHIGPEVILLSGKYYVYQTHHESEKDAVNSFWRNLGDISVEEHFMQHYLQNIASKLDGAEAVSYQQRERYIQD